jgi:hypothetical protein
MVFRCVRPPAHDRSRPSMPVRRRGSGPWMAHRSCPDGSRMRPRSVPEIEPYVAEAPEGLSRRARTFVQGLCCIERRQGSSAARFSRGEFRGLFSRRTDRLISGSRGVSELPVSVCAMALPGGFPARDNDDGSMQLSHRGRSRPVETPTSTDARIAYRPDRGRDHRGVGLRSEPSPRTLRTRHPRTGTATNRGCVRRTRPNDLNLFGRRAVLCPTSLNATAPV